MDRLFAFGVPAQQRSNETHSIMASSEEIIVTGFMCTTFLSDLWSFIVLNPGRRCRPHKHPTNTCRRSETEPNPTTRFCFMNQSMLRFRNAPKLCNSNVAKNSKWEIPHVAQEARWTQFSVEKQHFSMPDWESPLYWFFTFSASFCLPTLMLSPTRAFSLVPSFVGLW